MNRLEKTFHRCEDPHVLCWHCDTCSASPLECVCEVECPTCAGIGSIDRVGTLEVRYCEECRSTGRRRMSLREREYMQREVERESQRWPGLTSVSKCPRGYGPSPMALAGRVNAELEKIKEVFNKHTNAFPFVELEPPNKDAPFWARVEGEQVYAKPMPKRACEHAFVNSGTGLCAGCGEEVARCRYAGCRSIVLRAPDARGLCVLHWAQWKKAEGGPGMRINPPPSTCSVGMDWED